MTRTLLLCLLLALVAAAPVLAGDVNGKWNGKVTVTAPSGESRDFSIYIVLKVNGKDVTGTAGPSADQQVAIQKGKLEGDEVTFEINESADQPVFKVKLTFNEGRLKGEITREQGDDKQTGKIELTHET